MPLAIPLSENGGPLSKQIHRWLRRAVLAGNLTPGERLPSTRDLAEQLGVSRTVTVWAYDQLLAEGYVEGRAGSGTYISASLEAVRFRRIESPAKLRLSRFGLFASSMPAEVDSPGPARMPVRYDFAYGRSAVDDFPFETWRRLLIRRMRKAPVRTLDYGSSQGVPQLREAIATHLRRSRGVVCETSQILILSGSQQALDLAARVLMEPGETVAMEDPQYQGTREILRASGARILPVPVDGDGLQTAELPERARLAFVTPSHQFPTGTVLSLARRLALLDWAKRVDAVVIEDDYDGDFRYEGQSVESLQGLDSEGRVIYVGTFSRTIFPALRIGYLIAPKSLVRPFTVAKWLCDRHTPTLEQETLADFIATGGYERHLRRVRRENTLRRAALLEAISDCLSDRVEVTGESSGTHVVLWPKKRCSEAGVIARAAAQGVGVYGIAGYFLGIPSRAGLIIGYSRTKVRDIREGIRRLAKVIP